ncbi:glycosyltransferase family 9 protein [Geotalea uraniireducens]|uniref:Glycosyl transferase, family 9 n=1 Tax=Geotalea uraniireducens (strain Rf4) TaxID=351605 RepID=A5G6F8_GEOUR|nr:glycosyltransferase family 9 protein [Geotalea uraniireducens]ABQ27376.1 glycosyl transferase, family 9 [Geotalea uraniireducens Rf4]
MKETSNILIIKPGAMGDLLQMTPVIRALKKKLPEARISILVGNAASVDLFRHHPHVHETIVFDRRVAHRSLSSLLGLWQRLRGGHYDLVLNFQRSNLKSWFLASAAFPCRVLVYNKARGRTVHAVINHLETLGRLGISPSDVEERLELFLGDEDVQHAQELFRLNGFAGKSVVALNPGASNLIKCWSTGQFAALGDRLMDELGAEVVVVGGSERELAQDICARMRRKPLNLVEKTSMLQLGAVLAQCALLVSGDTGPMHMATAVGTPVVALFGAIEPRRTGPVGEGHRVIRHAEIECVPCNARKCSNPHYLECMERISVDEVFAAVAQMLGKSDRLLAERKTGGPKQ